MFDEQNFDEETLKDKQKMLEKTCEVIEKVIYKGPNSLNEESKKKLSDIIRLSITYGFAQGEIFGKCLAKSHFEQLLKELFKGSQ